jgi:WD40 repeat protein
MNPLRLSRMAGAVPLVVALAGFGAAQAPVTFIIQEPHEQAELNTRPILGGWLAASDDGKVVVTGGHVPLGAFPKEPLLTVRFWDIAAAKEKSALKTMTHNVNGLALTRDGKTLALATTDPMRGGVDNAFISVWNTATGKSTIFGKGFVAQGRTLVFSPKGEYLAGAMADKTIKVWRGVASKDGAAGKELAVLKGHTESVNFLAFSPDGKTLASTHGIPNANRIGWNAGEIKLWDMPKGTEKASFRAHKARVTAMAFTPDGKFLVTGGGGHFIGGESDASIKFWNLATLKETGTLKGHKSAIHALALTADGRYLVSASGDNTIRVWNVALGLQVAQMHGDGITVDGAVLTANDTVLLTSGGQQVKIWDFRPAADGIGLAPPPNQTLPSEPRQRAVLKGAQAGPAGLAFAPDGKTLLSVSVDKSLRQWDVATGKELSNTPLPAEVNVCAFSPDCSLAALGCRDKVLRLWDVTAGKERAVLPGHVNVVMGLSFAGNGKTLASFDYGSGLAAGPKPAIKFWDVAAAKETGTLPESCHCLALSPDGAMLATGTDVRDTVRSNQVIGYVLPRLRLLDVPGAKEQAVLEGHTSRYHGAAYSGDGKLLATIGADRRLIIWDAATRKKLQTLRGHLTEVTSLAFSTDGGLLATGDGGGMVKLWDTASGKDLATFKVQRGRISHLAFSPDAKLLATGGSSEGALRVLEVPGK